MSADSNEIKALIDKGNLEEAEASCKFSLESRPDAQVYFLLAYVSHQLDKPTQVVEASRRAAELGLSDWSNGFFLGVALRALGEHEQALAAFETAHAAQPASFDLACALLRETAETRGLAAAEALRPSLEHPFEAGALDGVWRQLVLDLSQRKIRALLEAGQLDAADKGCRDLLESYDSAEIFGLLAYIEQQSGRFALAVTHASRAVELGLADWSNHFILGLSLRALGRQAEAREALRTAHALAPERLDIAEKLLEAAVAAGGVDAGRRLYAQLSPTLGDAAFTRAWHRIAFEAGDRAIAQTCGIICRQARARDWAQAAGQDVRFVEDVEQIPIVAPHVIGAPPDPFRTVVTSNQPYVADLRDVTIFSKSNIVLTPEGVAVNDTGAHERFGQLVSHRSDAAVIGQHGQELLLQPSAYQVEPLQAGIMLSGAASDAFGHWVPEYLPKLQFLEQHPDFRGRPIIVDEEMPDSHFDYLAAVVPNPIIRLASGRGLRCGRLLYSPAPTFYPIHLLPNDISLYDVGPASPRALRFLKQRVEEGLGAPAARGGKFYLSRRRMTWRRLLNDAEISAFLEGEGYETVFIETLSFAEQVRLFQRADSIIAANGSSLLNLIFAQTSVHVLILMQSNVYNWGGFCGQMGALGYDFRFVCGQALGDSSQKHADYSIPLGLLQSALASRD